MRSRQVMHHRAELVLNQKRGSHGGLAARWPAAPQQAVQARVFSHVRTPSCEWL